MHQSVDELQRKRKERVSIVTVTLGRVSLGECCASVDKQTFQDWHHYVLGDGTLPMDSPHPQRSTLGFSCALGAQEPAMNMPDGTPNPLLRWAIQHLDLAEFVCFLDDDNIYRPEFLERMIGTLEKDPSVGIVLCAVENLRAHWHDIDGFPEYRRCDNSGFVVRSACAKAIGFPFCRSNEECVQDFHFIKALAEKFGWKRLDERLVVFGNSPNFPPRRGGIRTVYSWALPVQGADLVKEGRVIEGCEKLKAAVDYDSLDAWALWHLGEAMMITGADEEARNAWRGFIGLMDNVGTMPDDWCEYTYGLAALVIGLEELAEEHFLAARKRAHENSFEERILRAENELNLAIYAVALGTSAEVTEHWEKAQEVGVDDIILKGTTWKIGVLRRALLLVPNDAGKATALARLLECLEMNSLKECP